MKRGILKSIAEYCQITPQHLSDILGKRKNPSIRLAVILEEYTSVSRMLWIWGSRKELREALEKSYSENDS
jgi:plasmid maintenance system antidote protein VapI